jgi:putative transposase
MINLLKPLKKQEEFAWLREVSATSLQIICQDLHKAYVAFFEKRCDLPNFKSRKKAKPNYPICNIVGLTYFKDGFVNIQKVGKVLYQTNYDIPQGRDQKFSNPRISCVNGKWILTVGIKRENQTPELTDKRMGIDLGLKDLAIVAIGDEQLVFHNINKSKRVRTLKHKQRHISRAISRKYRTNGNYEKTKSVVKCEKLSAEIDYKLSNIRHNYIHQTTHALVSMLPQTVTMEDLNVKGMMSNRHLSKAIQEQCLAEFIRQMAYKCEWNGIEFQQVSRFYPSSKTCSSCGYIKKDLRLKDRTYVCPECGAVIDRDHNAALNLMRYTSQNETGLAA